MGEAKDKKNEEIMELIKIAFAEELAGSDFLASFDYEEIAREYNGIGPSWLKEELRKKISRYLEIFIPAALIHDMRYSLSDGMREAFNFANYEFRDNCLKLANAAYPWYSWKRYRARAVAEILFDCVSSEAGWMTWRWAYEKKARDAADKTAATQDLTRAGAQQTNQTDGGFPPSAPSSFPHSASLRENSSFTGIAIFAALFLFAGCCRIVTIEKHDPKPVFDATGTNVVDYVDGGYDFRYRSIGLVTDVDGIEATKDENGVTIKVKNLKTDVSKENKEIVGASGTAVGNVVEKAIQGAKK